MTDAKTETEDEKAFNETLKRMLETPPTPHEKSAPTRAEDSQTATRTDQKSKPT